MNLLHTAAYQVQGRGPWHSGKIHAIREGERTYCGVELRRTEGTIQSGEREAVTCKGCLRSLDAADSYQQQQADWEQRRAELDRQRQEEHAQWWAWYSQYLQTPDWEQRRQLVLKRADGVCEGCHQQAAVHVHHLTYDHAGNELLFELVAVCRDCHQIAHPLRDIA